MILDTRDRRAKDAPQLWSKHYQFSRSQEKQAITAKLNSLTEYERTPERVDQIIGNNTWTVIECECCERFVDVAVRVSGPNSNDPLTICANCLSDAETLLQSAKATEETP